MYEVRNKAWEEYAERMDIPDAIGFDYTRKDVKAAFEAGWKARKTAEYEAVVNIGRDD